MKAIKIRFFCTIMCISFLFMVVPVDSFATVNEVHQQAITVKGKVTDNAGEPLPGVSIVLKGTTTGIMTDIDGKYSINVPNREATLVISYVGFVPQEHKVGNNTTLDIVLKEQSTDLDEVVVVGYGVQKKINLTGSVAAVKADKIENRATTTLSSSLSGLAGGVTVRQSSGKPGSDGANIIIRGRGTFDNNYTSPLVIVDGSEASIGSVNSDDVESISFLKDAASASIYGSRGANGVILITTKKGKRGDSPRVTYSGIVTSERMSGKAFRFENNYAEYMEMVNRYSTNTKGAPKFTEDVIKEWRTALANPNEIYTDATTGNKVPNWLAYPSTDWVDYLFKSTTSSKHNVSLTGGSDNTNYLISFNYLNSSGMLKNTALERYTGRINIESKINKFLTLGTNTFGTLQEREPGSTDLTYMFQVPPNIIPYYNGQYGGSDDFPSANNVLTQVMGTGGSYDQTRINTSWFAKLNLIDGLFGEVRYNYQTLIEEQATYGKKIDLVSFRTGKILRPGNEASSQSTTRSTERYINNTTTATLNYLKTFGSHDLSALVGAERYYWNYKGFWARRYGLLDLDLPDFNSSSDSSAPQVNEDPNNPGKRAEKDYSVVSYFGRLNYGFKGKYLLEFSLRRDGSSRFGPDSRWGTFPSFSGGWRISEEPFMDGLKDVVSNLKLRGSWGKLGNITSGYYSWQSSYSKMNYSFGGNIYNGLAIKTLGNNTLHWEEAVNTGIGLDMGLLKNKLNVEFDLYNRQTNNILGRPPMYLTMGTVGAPYTNTSDMRNRGVEVTLGWTDKIKDFQYSISANFSYNKNQVTGYKGKYSEGWVTDANGNRTWVTNRGDVSSISNDQIIVEGHMYNEYYLRTRHKGNGNYFLADGRPDPKGGPKDGIIRTKADYDWVKAMKDYKDPVTGKKPYSFVNGSSTDQNGGLYYGEVIYADLNGDGQYGGADDRYFTGASQIPKYGYGINVSAAWKGFDFNMTWAGQAGYKYLIYSRGFNDTKWQDGEVIPANARNNFYSYDAYAALNDASYDPAADPKANINAKYPRLGAVTHYNNDSELYDASYIKLKTIQIGYTFPKKWMEKAYIQKLRLFVSGENLLTITSFPGVDPEFGGGGFQSYPIPRMLSCGVNITF